jgi:hypothetical protein
MSMDRKIRHATTGYLANYHKPLYATPYVSNFSAPFATGDIHNRLHTFTMLTTE